MALILALNPGATSTKLGLFDGRAQLWADEIDYGPDDFAGCATVHDQVPRRYADIRAALQRHGFAGTLAAAVGRGGLVGPVRPGAYLVDADLLDVLEHRPVLEHASNIGAVLARLAADEFGAGCPAYIYDPVTVDSLCPEARLTGIRGIERTSTGHHLNMRAVARDCAARLGRDYADVNLVVVHVGGGATASAHRRGEVIDFVSDDEMMFSAERSGGLPLKAIWPVFDGMGEPAFQRLIRKNAGLMSHCGTKDGRAVEDRMAAGDEQAGLVMRALAFQIAKCVGALAAALAGEVDAIAFTGGMAHSDWLAAEIERRVGWIARFERFPGEEELPALAGGALRVVEGTETAHRIGEPA